MIILTPLVTVQRRAFPSRSSSHFQNTTSQQGSFSKRAIGLSGKQEFTRVDTVENVGRWQKLYLPIENYIKLLLHNTSNDGKEEIVIQINEWMNAGVGSGCFVGWWDGGDTVCQARNHEIVSRRDDRLF